MANKFKTAFTSLFNNKKEVVIIKESAINSDSIFRQMEGFNVEEIKFLKSLVDQPSVIQELLSGMEAKVRIIETLKGSIDDSSVLKEVDEGLNNMKTNIETLKKSALLAESVTSKLNKLIEVID